MASELLNIVLYTLVLDECLRLLHHTDNKEVLSKNFMVQLSFKWRQTEWHSLFDGTGRGTKVVWTSDPDY